MSCFECFTNTVSQMIIPKDIQKALRKHLTVMEAEGCSGDRNTGTVQSVGAVSLAYLGDVMLSAEYTPSSEGPQC